MFLHVKGYSRSKVTWGQIWFCCTSHQGPHWKPESSLYCVFDVDMHSPCPQAGAEGSWLRVSVCPRSFTASAPSSAGCTQTAPCPPHHTPHPAGKSIAWDGLPSHQRSSCLLGQRTATPAPSSALA